jgi:cobalamin biosynthesis protein CobT
MARCTDMLEMNADGESILLAYNRIKDRPTARKIIIVLSDGSPHAYNPGDCFTFTKNVVDYVGKRIEIFGIGILTDSVKRIYPHHAVLDNISTLESTLLEVAKKKIIN